MTVGDVLFLSRYLLHMRCVLIAFEELLFSLIHNLIFVLRHSGSNVVFLTTRIDLGYVLYLLLFFFLRLI